MVNETKKVVVELNTVTVDSIRLAVREGGWGVVVGYVLSDAGGTVARVGTVMLTVEGQMTLDALGAQIQAGIGIKEGLA